MSWVMLGATDLLPVLLMKSTGLEWSDAVILGVEVI